MSGTSFYKLKLKQTEFRNCKLQKADFSDADLSDARFPDCDLSRATFDNTNLERAYLRTATNFTINPEQNKIKGLKISSQNLSGLLEKYELDIE